MKKIHLFWILFASVAFTELHASHLSSGDIQYRYIGDSTGIIHHYEVSITQNRWVPGQVISPSIQVTVCSGCFASTTITLNLVAGGPGFLSPGLYDCVSPVATNSIPLEYNFYRGYAILPGTCASFSFNYSTQCCRENSIQNIVQPQNTTFSVAAKLNNTLGNNSSPRFLTPGLKHFCVGNLIHWAHPTSEPDGDSIFYRLVAAKNIVTTSICSTQTVDYTATFSAEQPMTTSPPNSLFLNPNTGTFTFTPAVSQNINIAFEVEEYRYDSTYFVWSLVGTSNREMQVGIAAACSPVAQLGVVLDYSLPNNGLDPLSGLPLIDVSCLSDSIEIDFASAIDCYTIAPDGSNFRFLMPNNQPFPIISASTICDVGNTTSKIVLKLNQPIIYNGNYKLFSKIGNNGTTIGTQCGFYQSEFDTIIIRVQGCPNISVDDFIYEKPEIFFPNTFTPNNDGINDNFIIEIVENVRGQFYLEIFNRWGQPVHRTSGTNTLSWDGTHLGKEASSGVYYYNMQHNPTGHSWQGHITLFR